MWCAGTWFSGGLGSVKFMVELDDLKGVSQEIKNHKWFYDSMAVYSIPR